MRWKFAIFGLVILLAVGGYRSLLFVDETEMVLVTQFGRPVATYLEAGFQWKMPWQSAIRLNRRLQIYDPRPSEFLAAEKKNVDLDVFVCWRVDQPQRFLETVNDTFGAEARIHDIVWSQLAATIGTKPLEALVSTDERAHELDEIQRTVTEACAIKAKDAYGLEIVDVRLKRIGVPAQVRESVFQRMRAERTRIARQYRAEGDKEAQMVRSSADKDRTIKLAEADAEAKRIRGKAEAEATRTYAEAHKQDPEFYELVRTLEAYKSFLDEKTTVLLSADSELLKFLTRGIDADSSKEGSRASSEPTNPN